MSKPNILLRVLFALLSMFIGLFAGMMIGSLTAPKTGFEGSAEVLVYGLMGLAAGLIFSLLLIRRLTQKSMVTALLVAGSLCVIIIGWFVFRIGQVN